MASFLACGSPSSTGDGGDGTDPAPDAAPPDAPVADASVLDADAGDGGLPDLTVNLARAQIDLALRTADFEPDDCELDPDEACVLEPGTRRLLHFALETPNLGDGDMVLGAPDPDNPNFVYSECHKHYHFAGYAAYRLVDPDGGEVAAGRKQAFCLLDVERYLPGDPTVAASPKYSCSFQGIQRGWSDVYDTSLPCQFIDVTDVPDGDYTLEIRLNSNETLLEKSYDNNLVTIPVELGAPELSEPTEICPDGIDAHSGEGTHRECGWSQAGTFACAPGTTASVGCSAAPACGGTECTGDPMIRVCDAASTDGNCSFPAAIRSTNDSEGSQCPCTSVRCPESGQLSVYTAPFQIGEPYECEVQVQPVL